VSDYLVTGVLSGAAYGLLAMGFVLVYKGTRVFNLAHGEIGGIGVYVAWSRLGVLPVAAAALTGVAVAAALAVAVEVVLIRRLTDTSAMSGLAVTLGVALSLAYAEALLWGYNVKTFPSPVGTGTVRVGSSIVTAPRLAALVAAVAAVLGLELFLHRTRFGLAMRAATSDDALARLSGVAVHRARAAAWAIGGALSGISAVLLAPVFTFHPLSNSLILARVLAAALLGGVTSLPGALAGGLAVGLAESLVVSQMSEPGMVDGVIFLMILVTLLARPEGLLGAEHA
jgi:branched-chain amino acid transport system permease protein